MLPPVPPWSGPRQRRDELARRAWSSVSHRLQLSRARLVGWDQRLEVLNPMSVLGRGFAVVSRSDGELVRSVTQVSSGDALNVRLVDGDFGVRVEGET